MSYGTLRLPGGGQQVVSGEIGEYVYLAHDTVPVHCLACNGAAVSRLVYAKLFAKIGTRYGIGDGNTTFNLPDARGVVSRGVDNGRGLDPDRALGSYQEDAIRNITGWISNVKLGSSHGVIFDCSGAFLQSSNPDALTGAAAVCKGSEIYHETFDASRVVPTASENRMKNLAVFVCIVYE